MPPRLIPEKHWTNHRPELHARGQAEPPELHASDEWITVRLHCLGLWPLEGPPGKAGETRPGQSGTSGSFADLPRHGDRRPLRHEG